VLANTRIRYLPEATMFRMNYSFAMTIIWYSRHYRNKKLCPALTLSWRNGDATSTRREHLCTFLFLSEKRGRKQTMGRMLRRPNFIYS